MHRVWGGDSLIKIVVPEPSPGNSQKTGDNGAFGYRY